MMTLQKEMKVSLIHSLDEWPEHWTQKAYAKTLHEWLKPYTDPEDAILLALGYALNSYHGGGVLFASRKNELIGTVVVNQTGMKKYIPENILVYIAVSPNHRGKGLGSHLIKTTLSSFKGSFKLHVEYPNPAKKLYERLGFTNPYAEMRHPNDNS